jgi:hypothetical protein
MKLMKQFILSISKAVKATYLVDSSHLVVQFFLFLVLA